MVPQFWKTPMWASHHEKTLAETNMQNLKLEMRNFVSLTNCVPRDPSIKMIPTLGPKKVFLFLPTLGYLDPY